MTRLRVRLESTLRELRLTRRLTQEELAERAGLSYKFLGEVERGLGNPSVDTLVSLADALGVDIVDLFGRSERQSSTEVHGIAARDLRMVREALESAADVLQQLDSPTARYRKIRRPRTRKR